MGKGEIGNGQMWFKNCYSCSTHSQDTSVLLGYMEQADLSADECLFSFFANFFQSDLRDNHYSCSPQSQDASVLLGYMERTELARA